MQVKGGESGQLNWWGQINKLSFILGNAQNSRVQPFFCTITIFFKCYMMNYIPTVESVENSTSWLLSSILGPSNSFFWPSYDHSKIGYDKNTTPVDFWTPHGRCFYNHLAHDLPPSNSIDTFLTQQRRGPYCFSFTGHVYRLCDWAQKAISSKQWWWINWTPNGFPSWVDSTST